MIEFCLRRVIDDRTFEFIRACCTNARLHTTRPMHCHYNPQIVSSVRVGGEKRCEDATVFDPLQNAAQATTWVCARASIADGTVSVPRPLPT